MTNGQAANLLYKIARMLEFTEENSFKARAYRNAADAVLRSDEPVETLVKQGRIHELHGVGRGIGDVLADLVQTGSSPILTSLQEQVPLELPAMLQISGLGIKSIRRLYQELGIRSIEQLEAACKAHQIQFLRGYGPKAEAKILDGINALRKMPDQFPLGVVLLLADPLINHISNWEGVVNISAVGSVRRMRETVRNLNLLAVCESGSEIGERFISLPMVVEVLIKQQSYWKVSMQLGRYTIPVDMRTVSVEQYGLAMVQYTGSSQHVEQLWERLQEIEVTHMDFYTETDFYKELKLPWISPELREGRGEVQAAVENCLPDLIELAHIRGDLHVHSTWSDGAYSIGEMAEHARNLGYQYMSITDHSRSLSIARGLSIEQLKRQREEIHKLNMQWADFHIFAGVEMDILADGSLDFPDEVLAELDYVIGSVHSAFKQPEEKMTERVLRAVRNPYVNVIAHPTGRLLTRRPGYAINLEEVCKVAAETGTAIEMNCSPNRLDFNDLAAKRAKQLGVKLVISTDSHDIDEFASMRLGVATARRAWLSPEDVINTWDRTKLEMFFKQKKTQKNTLYPS